MPPTRINSAANGARNERGDIPDRLDRIHRRACGGQLLRDQHGASLNVLVRARDAREAEGRLWRSLQLHLKFPEFYEYLQTRVRVFRGDLTDPGFGLERDDYDRLVHTTDSVIHCAASLNRKSEKSCLNVNLRGTLEVLHIGAARASTITGCAASAR